MDKTIAKRTYFPWCQLPPGSWYVASTVGVGGQWSMTWVKNLDTGRDELRWFKLYTGGSE